MEVICNILMFLIVLVSFFCVGMPSRNIGLNNPENVFSNVIISVISFPMNIDVFENTIHMDQIFSDLWGWHIFWIMCVIVQILLLSCLGEKLLYLIQECLKWAKKNIAMLGNIISGIIQEIERGVKTAGLIIIIGTVLWGIFLYRGIYAQGMHTFFSDKSFLLGSMQIWLICFFIYIIVFVIKNFNGIFYKINIYKVLTVFGGIALLAALIYIFPMLDEVLKSLLNMLIFPVCSLLLSVAPTVRRVKKKRVNQEGENMNKVRTSDLIIVVISFVWVPLNLIYLSTYAFHGGGKILTTQDLSDLNTWMDFWRATLDSVNSLRQLLNI